MLPEHKCPQISATYQVCHETRKNAQITVHTCIYKYTHTHTYIYIYHIYNLYMYTYIHTYTYTHTYRYMRIIHMHIHIHIHMHIHAHIHAHTHAHTYMHIYIYICMHIYIYICMHLCRTNEQWWSRNPIILTHKHIITYILTSTAWSNKHKLVTVMTSHHYNDLQRIQYFAAYITLQFLEIRSHKFDLA